MTTLEKMGIHTVNRKTYKSLEISFIDMNPGDPSGSPDESFFLGGIHG